MAYVALTTGQCDANSPLDETLMLQIKANFDDHESRILVLEAGKTIASDGSFALSAFGTYTPAAGRYNFIDGGAGATDLELYVSAAWRIPVGGERVAGTHIMDGTNMRLNEWGGGADTVWYQKFNA